MEMSSPAEVRHAKRRTNYIDHDPATMAYLVDFNDKVGLYYWIGLIGMIGVVAIANAAKRFQGFRRRRKAGFRDSTKRLPRVKSIEPDMVVHHASPRYFWYWLDSFWRKYSIKHSYIAEWFYLGDLGQLFLIAVYLLLNFLLIFLGTEGDIDWMAHHAAKLTYANLPLIIGLAGKNNILSKVTGFAYESLNVLHRWSARFVILSSAIHIGGRIHVNVPSVHPDTRGQRYVAWGWLAFALFIYMILMASRKIRNRAYQFFLIQHVFIWFILVAALVIHRPQLQGWIWAGFALHGLDRVGRGCRIAYYHLLRTVEEREDLPTGRVTVLSPDTVRVSVRTRQNWIPGQHVYLHCPEQSLGGHPFTVSNISRPLTQADNKRPTESTQELIIRVREGLTKRIFRHGSNAKDDETIVEGKGSNRFDSVPIKAWTEGPYGHEKYLGEDYGTLMLVAGGSGVSYSLSNALDIVRRARAMHLGSTDKSIAVAVQRLSLVWMVKRPDQVDWISDHLKDMCLAAPPGFLHITIFITGKREAKEPAVLDGFVTLDRRDGAPVAGSPSQATKSRPKSAGPTRKPSEGDDTTVTRQAKERVEHGAVVELRSGRPNFVELVHREVEATGYQDWLAIGCCGPTPMNDSLADAVSAAVQPTQVLRGEVRRDIYLTIEEFGW